MAPMKNALLAAVALVSLASAMPMAIDARGIVVNTVTETAWTTVDVTKTVYVDDEPTAAPEVEEPAAPAATTAAPEPEKAVEEPNAPAAFVEQSQPEPSSQSQPAAPAPSSSAPVVDTPAPASPSANVQPKTAGAATGGPCEGPGSGCSGDVTYYEGGLGACGWNVNTASDLSVALPAGLMGSQSNGNPYCGRKIAIQSPDSGEVIEATVGDKCTGCERESIDLTDALFKLVVPNGDGRVAGVEWWFA